MSSTQAQLKQAKRELAQIQLKIDQLEADSKRRRRVAPRPGTKRKAARRIVRRRIPNEEREPPEGKVLGDHGRYITIGSRAHKKQLARKAREEEQANEQRKRRQRRRAIDKKRIDVQREIENIKPKKVKTAKAAAEQLKATKVMTKYQLFMYKIVEKRQPGRRYVRAQHDGKLYESMFFRDLVPTTAEGNIWKTSAYLATYLKIEMKRIGNCCRR